MRAKTTHILVVEDEAAHAEMIRRAFADSSSEVILNTAPTLHQARAVLAASAMDLVIADLFLPDGMGTELLAGRSNGRPFPVLIMTGQGDEHAAVEAIKSGALDYVVKSPASLANMPRIAERALREWQHITEHERAERELHQSRRDWMDIFQAIGHPTMIVDPEHAILTVNRAAVEVFKKSEDELRACKCHVIFHGADQAPKDCPMEKMRQSGRVETAEMEIAAFGGNFLISCTPVFDESGGLQKIIHIATDVTQQRKLQDQLFQSQKLESIGKLAGGIAHDFGNILNVIMCSASMLDRQSLSEKARELVDDIAKASERGSSLIQQLLAYAQGGQREMKPTDLNALITSVTRMLTRTAPATIHTATQLSETLPPIMADAAQIEQVVMNLHLNAIEASAPSGTITISTQEHVLASEAAAALDLPQGRYVCLRVEDQGCGIDEQTKGRMFEPFFTTKPSGRGMGLSAVLGIIKSHHGQIRVDSAPGKGTTISVWLPIESKPPE